MTPRRPNFQPLGNFQTWKFAPDRPRAFSSWPLLLLLISCAETTTTITGYERGKPIGTHETRTIVYGKHSTSSLLFMEQTMANLDIGFGKLANLAALLVSAYIAGDVARAREVTDQMAAAGATKAQITKIQTAAKTEALRISAGTTGEGIKAGLFAPEAATFIQP